MNPVLILTKNNLNLTKRCIESVRAQDIPVSIFVYDNESEDGTDQWVGEQDDIQNLSNCLDLGVSAAWNYSLETLFLSGWGAEHVLVLNNDTALPRFFYRRMFMCNFSFVTGASVTDDPHSHPEAWEQPAECPDFSAFLIRRDCWQRVGYFNEDMRLYYSDNDYHVRAHNLGVTLWNAGIPFYHERSSTLRHADLFERREMELRADEDKAEFFRIYGCTPRDPEYAKLFK